MRPLEKWLSLQAIRPVQLKTFSRKAKKNIAITLKDTLDAVTTYFHTRLVASIEVKPAPGHSEINPDELFSVHVVATNSKVKLAQAVQFANMRYQVRIDTSRKRNS